MLIILRNNWVDKFSLKIPHHDASQGSSLERCELLGTLVVWGKINTSQKNPNLKN